MLGWAVAERGTGLAGNGKGTGGRPRKELDAGATGVPGA